MTKSLIEQELEKLQEQGTWYKYYTKNKNLMLILQKVREELIKKKICMSTVAFHICEEHPDDCDFFILYSEVEKVI